MNTFYHLHLNRTASRFRRSRILLVTIRAIRWPVFLAAATAAARWAAWRSTIRLAIQRALLRHRTSRSWLLRSGSRRNSCDKHGIHRRRQASRHSQRSSGYKHGSALDSCSCCHHPRHFGRSNRNSSAACGICRFAIAVRLQRVLSAESSTAASRLQLLSISGHQPIFWRLRAGLRHATVGL